MGPVTSGKRAAPGGTPGPRASGGAAPPPVQRSSSPAPLLLLALGITAAVVAWGYLVYLAIDFGTRPATATRPRWWFLALATIGAIACLFVA